MQVYYIVRPKQSLILDVNLCWRNCLECIGSGSGVALGVEMAESLNIAAWVSFDGISAVPYPEDTACSLFEKNTGKAVSLNKETFSRPEFVKAVNYGRFPDFLLRKPSNKAEKKLLFGSYGKRQMKKDFIRGEAVTTSLSKEELRGDNARKERVENMFYIVNTKKNLFLSKSLTWIDIGSIKKNKKLMSQLFCVRDSIATAQTLSLWVTPPSEIASPCTPSTLKRKYRLVFPNPSSDSLSDGIRTRKYPAFLSKRPESRREVVAFQMALRDGLKDLEERTFLSLGKLSTPNWGEEKGNLSEFIHDSSSDNCSPSDLDLLSEEDLLSEKPSSFERSEPFSFQNHTSSVIETSDLIRSIIETSISFGKMVSDAPSLVAQKKLDLEIIHRQLLDLDHVAEFYSLNASDGYRMNKTRKEYLQQRRVIKNEICVLELIMHYFSNGATPNGINGLVNSIMNLDRRCYTTRALTVSEVKKLIRNPKTQALILGESTEPMSEQTEMVSEVTSYVQE